MVDLKQLDRWLVANGNAGVVQIWWRDALHLEARGPASAAHDRPQVSYDQICRGAPAFHEAGGSGQEGQHQVPVQPTVVVCEELFRAPTAALLRGVLRTSTAMAWPGRRLRRSHRFSAASFGGEQARRALAAVPTVIVRAGSARLVCEAGGANRARGAHVRAEVADERIVASRRDGSVCIDRAWLVHVLEWLGPDQDVRVLRAALAEGRTGPPPMVIVESEQLRAAVQSLPWFLGRAAHRLRSAAGARRGPYPCSILVRAADLTVAIERLRAKALESCAKSTDRIGRTMRWTYYEDETLRDAILDIGAGDQRAIQLVLTTRVLPSGPRSGSRRWVRTVQVRVPERLLGDFSPITIGWRTAGGRFWNELSPIARIKVAQDSAHLRVVTLGPAAGPPAGDTMTAIIPLVPRGVPAVLEALNDNRQAEWASLAERQRMAEAGKLDEVELERLAEDEARVAWETKLAAKSAGVFERLEKLRGKPVDI